MLIARSPFYVQRAFFAGHSSRWIQRQRKDIYVKQSKKDGYRCRSAYKLIQLNEKYKILKPGQNVVDLGACPGSWSQVATEYIFPQNSTLDSTFQNVMVAVDLNDLEPLPHVAVLSKDFTLASTRSEIQKLLPDGKANVILSDMAPNACGDNYTDHVRIIELCELVLEFCHSTLSKDGHMVCKVWDGPFMKDFIGDIQHRFKRVQIFKPKSSRKESAETYLVSMYFKAPLGNA